MTDPGPRRSRRRTGVLVGVLTAAVVIAGVLSFYASASPDGLNRVALDEGFAALEKDHPAASSPLADYSTRGVDDERMSGGLAGLIGVGLTFLLGGAVFTVVRRRPGA